MYLTCSHFAKYLTPHLCCPQCHDLGYNEDNHDISMCGPGHPVDDGIEVNVCCSTYLILKAMEPRMFNAILQKVISDKLKADQESTCIVLTNLPRIPNSILAALAAWEDSHDPKYAIEVCSKLLKVLTSPIVREYNNNNNKQQQTKGE